MMEPLSVGVHSVANLGKCKSDQTVIVFGAGPVGLLCMAVAKALGARRVIAVDIQQERLDFARSYVATDVFLPVSGVRGPSWGGGVDGGRADSQEARKQDEDAAAYCTRMAQSILSTLGLPALGPGAVDLTIEASGAPSCVQMGIQVLKPA
jgi:L-iditol 2-dehydrogenase/D-xylulose reductase